ncbi:hypothetical protein OAB57_01930 [Bacteriovoracaceae bacterium]|nr:hypothetical protein [Bacteriovoracaceae bacterium]
MKIFFSLRNISMQRLLFVLVTTISTFNVSFATDTIPDPFPAISPFVLPNYNSADNVTSISGVAADMNKDSSRACFVYPRYMAAPVLVCSKIWDDSAVDFTSTRDWRIEKIATWTGNPIRDDSKIDLNDLGFGITIPDDDKQEEDSEKQTGASITFNSTYKQWCIATSTPQVENAVFCTTPKTDPLDPASWLDNDGELRKTVLSNSGGILSPVIRTSGYRTCVAYTTGKYASSAGNRTGVTLKCVVGEIKTDSVWAGASGNPPGDCITSTSPADYHSTLPCRGGGLNPTRTIALATNGEWAGKDNEIWCSVTNSSSTGAISRDVFLTCTTKGSDPSQYSSWEFIDSNASKFPTMSGSAYQGMYRDIGLNIDFVDHGGTGGRWLITSIGNEAYAHQTNVKVTKSHVLSYTSHSALDLSNDDYWHEITSLEDRESFHFEMVPYHKELFHHIQVQSDKLVFTSGNFETHKELFDWPHTTNGYGAWSNVYHYDIDDLLPKRKPSVFLPKPGLLCAQNGETVDKFRCCNSVSNSDPTKTIVYTGPDDICHAYMPVASLIGVSIVDRVAKESNPIEQCVLVGTTLSGEHELAETFLYQLETLMFNTNIYNSLRRKLNDDSYVDTTENKAALLNQDLDLQKKNDPIKRLEETMNYFIFENRRSSILYKAQVQYLKKITVAMDECTSFNYVENPEDEIPDNEDLHQLKCFLGTNSAETYTLKKKDDSGIDEQRTIQGVYSSYAEINEQLALEEKNGEDTMQLSLPDEWAPGILFPTCVLPEARTSADQPHPAIDCIALDFQNREEKKEAQTEEEKELQAHQSFIQAMADRISISGPVVVSLLFQATLNNFRRQVATIDSILPSVDKLRQQLYDIANACKNGNCDYPKIKNDKDSLTYYLPLLPSQIRDHSGVLYDKLQESFNTFDGERANSKYGKSTLTPSVSDLFMELAGTFIVLNDNNVNFLKNQNPSSNFPPTSTTDASNLEMTEAEEVPRINGLIAMIQKYSFTNLDAGSSVLQAIEAIISRALSGVVQEDRGPDNLSNLGDDLYMYLITVKNKLNKESGDYVLPNCTQVETPNQTGGGTGDTDNTGFTNLALGTVNTFIGALPFLDGEKFGALLNDIGKKFESQGSTATGGSTALESIRNKKNDILAKGKLAGAAADGSGAIKNGKSKTKKKNKRSKNKNISSLGGVIANGAKNGIKSASITTGSNRSAGANFNSGASSAANIGEYRSDSKDKKKEESSETDAKDELKKGDNASFSKFGNGSTKRYGKRGGRRTASKGSRGLSDYDKKNMLNNIKKADMQPDEADSIFDRLSKRYVLTGFEIFFGEGKKKRELPPGLDD